MVRLVYSEVLRKEFFSKNSTANTQKMTRAMGSIDKGLLIEWCYTESHFRDE